MALHRGIQSAIFYYLSCAPCSDARYRKKRKQEAIQDRAERELLEAQMPNLYRHPSPSSTNPHWHAEISLGPTLPYRGKRKIHTAESQRELKKSGTYSSNGSNIPSSVDLPRSSGSDGRHDSKWNFRPYQRDDEELWGSSHTEPALRSHLDGSTAIDGLARPARVRTADSTKSSTYRSFRNPAVNDLHPAIVTRVESRDDVAWMMQPPPVAEVMSGKERAPRSRSDSGGSRPSAHGSTKLSRQVSARNIEKRLKAGETDSTLGIAREPSTRSTTSAPRPILSKCLTGERDFASSPEKRSKQKPPPLWLSDAAETAGTVTHQPMLTPESERPQQVRRRSSRPPLSPIMSESDDIPKYNNFPLCIVPKENAFPSPLGRDGTEPRVQENSFARPMEMTSRDAEIRSFEHAGLKSPFFDSRSPTESPGSRNRLQAPEEEEHRHSMGDPAVFYTPEFELDKWVHEHTKREGIRQRWSMDL
ncbi:Hypothetical protein R9X50_00250200 [Acrodontium crateriforme]|uniref:Uncharacterized protein n=1 Tax=Acrodontium crateriforme TaxID=150365 RepID=A0AAQ3R6Q4_9PEZI|nr:Hypothetical protein R9X50_00250200 [Acrodontium crateriforme]